MKKLTPLLVWFAFLSVTANANLNCIGHILESRDPEWLSVDSNRSQSGNWELEQLVLSPDSEFVYFIRSATQRSDQGQAFARIEGQDYQLIKMSLSHPSSQARTSLDSDRRTEFDSELYLPPSLRLAISPVDELVAHSTAEGTVHLRSSDNLEFKHTLGEQVRRVGSENGGDSYTKKTSIELFFSPNGRYLVDRGHLNTTTDLRGIPTTTPFLNIWDITKKTIVHSAEKKAAEGECVFTPGGEFAVLANRADGIRLYSTENWSLAKSFPVQDTYGAILPISNTEILVKTHEQLLLWNLQSGKVDALANDMEGDLMELSPDRTQIMIGSRGNTRLYSWPQLTPQIELKDHSPILPFFSNNIMFGRFVSVLTRDATVQAGHYNYRVRLIDRFAGALKGQVSFIAPSESDQHLIRSPEGSSIVGFKKAGRDVLRINLTQALYSSFRAPAITSIDLDPHSNTLTVTSKDADGFTEVREVRLGNR